MPNDILFGIQDNAAILLNILHWQVWKIQINV